MKKISSFLMLISFIFVVSCYGGGSESSSESDKASTTETTITEGDLITIGEEIPPVPEVIVPGDPVIVEVYTENITAFLNDAEFFYLENTSKILWHFKNKALTKATLTYTAVEKTYTDGVLTNTVNIPLSTYEITEFFSITTNSVKTLYFTVHERHYKQVAGVITQVNELPTKPAKSLATYGTKYITITHLYSDALGSRVTRKLSPSAWDDAIKAKRIEDRIYVNHATYSNSLVINVVDNMNGTVNFPTTGLYLYSDLYTLYIYPIKLAPAGSMW